MFPRLMTFKDVLVAEYQIVFDQNKVYYKYIYDKEVFVAEFLVRIILQPFPPVIDPIYEMATLTDEQKQAIYLALNNNISFYQGPAGCGKSSIIKEIVRNNDMNDIEYALTSFTGKATSRIKELTTKPAFTLDYLMSKETLNTVDHIIIDEFSMTSLDLIYRLFEKLSHRQNLPKITMVGDDNQLCPISYGFPFREIIKIPRIDRVMLTKNHRLDTDNPDEHGVMLACKEILEGPPTRFHSCETFTITHGDQATVAALFQQFKDTGYTQDDVACITPYRDAVKSINIIASEIFHPDAQKTDPSNTIKKVVWRVGDKIVVNVNLYNIMIMNGEVGVITKINHDHVFVAFNGGKKVAQLGMFRRVTTKWMKMIKKEVIFLDVILK